MNLKLNNDTRDTNRLHPKRTTSAIKEERRRTGRYIAILVGISLFLLAIYHAWVRRIPVVASLVVPALIMFIYVAWVLYTASKDKHRALDMEAALRATNTAANLEDISPITSTNDIEISIISEDIIHGDDSPKLSKSIILNSIVPRVVLNTKVEHGSSETADGHLVRPIILVNDKPPDDIDASVVDLVKVPVHLGKKLILNEKIRTKRRIFYSKRRNNVYKRSYSIA